jgi:hypothetical protein
MDHEVGRSTGSAVRSYTLDQGTLPHLFRNVYIILLLYFLAWHTRVNLEAGKRTANVP